MSKPTIAATVALVTAFMLVSAVAHGGAGAGPTALTQLAISN